MTQINPLNIFFGFFNLQNTSKAADAQFDSWSEKQNDMQNFVVIDFLSFGHMCGQRQSRSRNVYIFICKCTKWPHIPHKKIILNLFHQHTFQYFVRQYVFLLFIFYQNLFFIVLLLNFHPYRMSIAVREGRFVDVELFPASVCISTVSIVMVYLIESAVLQVNE